MKIKSIKLDLRPKVYPSLTLIKIKAIFSLSLNVYFHFIRFNWGEAIILLKKQALDYVCLPNFLKGFSEKHKIMSY